MSYKSEAEEFASKASRIPEIMQKMSGVPDEVRKSYREEVPDAFFTPRPS